MSAAVLGGNALAGALFRNTFLFTWYNRHPLKRHVVTATDYTVEREGGVVANVRMSDRRLTVTENGRMVVDGGQSSAMGLAPGAHRGSVALAKQLLRVIVAAEAALPADNRDRVAG